MSIDIDDLIGGDKAAEPKKRGRPPKNLGVEAAKAKRRREIEAEYEARKEVLPIEPIETPDSTDQQRLEAIRQASVGRSFVEAGEIRRPVSKNWLAEALQMSSETVAKRLTNCPILGSTGGGRHVYDFKTAVRYLLPPLMDLGEYIQVLRPQDLPVELNKVFHEGMRQKLKYEHEAGESWSTESVLDVFGDVFMTIKDRTQLWTETLRERGGLNEKQYAMLTEMVDGLLNDLHESLVDMPNRRKTPNRLEELNSTLSEYED